MSMEPEEGSTSSGSWFSLAYLCGSRATVVPLTFQRFQASLEVLQVVGKVWKGFPEESGRVVVEKPVVSRGDWTPFENTPT